MALKIDNIRIKDNTDQLMLAANSASDMMRKVEEAFSEFKLDLARMDTAEEAVNRCAKLLNEADMCRSHFETLFGFMYAEDEECFCNHIKCAREAKSDLCYVCLKDWLLRVFFEKN